MIEAIIAIIAGTLGAVMDAIAHLMWVYIGAKYGALLLIGLICLVWASSANKPEKTHTQYLTPYERAMIEINNPTFDAKTAPKPTQRDHPAIIPFDVEWEQTEYWAAMCKPDDVDFIWHGHRLRKTKDGKLKAIVRPKVAT